MDEIAPAARGSHTGQDGCAVVWTPSNYPQSAAVSFACTCIEPGVAMGITRTAILDLG